MGTHLSLSYLDDLSRINSTEYIPSPEDVIKLHSPTQGIEETVLELDDMGGKLRLFEAGHMLSERRKWIPYVDDVDAIAFMVPLSMYDCGRYAGKDAGLNPFQAALWDLGAIMDMALQHEWMKRTRIILLFNGTDKFLVKLPTAPLEHSFPDFKGSESASDASSFLVDLFNEQADHLRQQPTIYNFFTASLDQPHIRFVLAAILGKRIIELSGIT